ncbi:MAG: MFS transporter [Planctomycetota bacterium]
MVLAVSGDLGGPGLMGRGEETEPSPGRRRRALVAWGLYDFGNSAFTTLIVTFVYAAWFTRSFAPDEATGTAWWSRAVTLSAVLVALASPVVGALADRSGRRKPFLLFFTLLSIVATVRLCFVESSAPVLALVVFGIANVAYEMGCVLYNAFLPDIAPPGRIGRVSGFGWGLGYLGGILALLLALFLLIRPDPPLFGLTRDGGQNVRAVTLLVAAWFAVFAVPLFLWVPDARRRGAPAAPGAVRAAFRQLGATFREIRRYRQVVRFLIARLVYNDGLITIFAFGGIYASGTFGFSTEKLIWFGILLNVTAAAGAFVLGFLDDRLGGKRTILLTLGALVLATTGALLARDGTLFWIFGALLGIFVGPNQSASRSLMGRFVPPDLENEFFGFFAFSGKASAFLGPLLLGIVTEASGSQRVGLSVVLLFFVVGGVILWGVDEQEGEAAGGRATSAD